MKKSDITKAQILQVAIDEFADKGIHGARVDRIAEKANINKGMIYQYYKSKENLYKIVLRTVYEKISITEQAVICENKNFDEKLYDLIFAYFHFLNDNPDYVQIVMWENLNKGIFFKELELGICKNPIKIELTKLVQDGKNNGVIKPEIDSEQLFLNIIGMCFNYFSNKNTLESVIGQDFLDENQINKRIDAVFQAIIFYLSV